MAPLASGTAIEVGPGLHADVSGHLVVWVPYTAVGSPLNVLDLQSGRKWTLVDSGGPTQPDFPSIDGLVAAWIQATQDTSGGFLHRIAIDSIDNEGAFLAPGDSQHHDVFPRISGDEVVWTRRTNASAAVDLVAYNIASGRTSVLPTQVYDLQAAVDGGQVVFARAVTGTIDSVRRSDIVLWNIGSGQLRTLSDSSAEQGSVDISGDGVVWIWHHGEAFDVVYRNVRTGQTTNITNGWGRAALPRISGSRIVWQDDRSGDYDIYMYNLNTDREVRLTIEPGDQMRPAISGAWVIWDDRNVSPWQVRAMQVGNTP